MSDSGFVWILVSVFVAVVLGILVGVSLGRSMMLERVCETAGYEAGYLENRNAWCMEEGDGVKSFISIERFLGE